MVGSVVQPVVRVDGLRLDPEQVGDLLDDHVVDERGELESSRARSSIGQRWTTRRTVAPAVLDARERDRVEVERVGGLGRRDLLDRELELGELVAPRRSRCSTASSTRSSNCSARLRSRGIAASASGPRGPRPRRSRLRRAVRAAESGQRLAVERSEHDPQRRRAASPPTPHRRHGAARLGQSAGAGPARGVASSAVRPVRRCSRAACGQPAVATLTYVYSDSTAVLGPLATYAEPHCYDLCARHSERLTAPRGWEVIRLAPDPDALVPTHDDLEALANAVREAAQARSTPSRSALASRSAAAVTCACCAASPDQPPADDRDAGRRGPTRLSRRAPT